jgi:hypothetical protein
VGNTVTLAGNKRFVTQFSFNVVVGSSNIGQTNDFILRLYVPSAPGGYPGKLLWQSPPKTNVVMTGSTQSVTIEVPFVRVPNTFIYSVQQAGDAFFPLCYGPTVGSSPNYLWTNLTKHESSGANYMQVRIEAEQRPDAVLLARIADDGYGGIGGEDYYSMRFSMRMGGYWDLFAPSFYGVTEWDEGSYLKMDAADIPEAVEYLTNGLDETLRVQTESYPSGNVESDTLAKSAGIAAEYPDLDGCVITDIGLQLNTIEIDHGTPGWTYYTWDVVWEIWGIQKSADINRDGAVDLRDFAIFAAAWGSVPGQANWNALCDLDLPEDDVITVLDLDRFCMDWLSTAEPVFEEGFETGDFSRYSWQHSGNAAWMITSSAVYAGTYAARSGVIGHNQQSVLQVEVEVEEGSITFYKKVSSESGWDLLRFYIDGVQKGAWSGTIDWSQQTYPVTAGTHTFKWAYIKDGSVSSGSDCAWIDNIRFD